MLDNLWPNPIAVIIYLQKAIKIYNMFKLNLVETSCVKLIKNKIVLW